AMRAAGGAVAVRHLAVRRFAGGGGAEVLSQVPAVEPVRDPLDEHAVHSFHTVLLGWPDRALGHRRLDRLAVVLGGSGHGIRRHAGALVRVVPDRPGHWSYPG